MTSAQAKNPLMMIAALLVAGGHFLFIYVFAAIVCAKGFGDREIAGFPILTVVIATATAVALLVTLFILIGALIRMRWRAQSSSDAAPAPIFLAWMTAAFAALCLIAITWYSLPILITPRC